MLIESPQNRTVWARRSYRPSKRFVKWKPALVILKDVDITSEEQLRAIIGNPQEVVVSKITDRLNPLTMAYIERSPFICLATSNGQGDCDVSPRGDPSGFVRILDDRTLLIPERPGNKIADTLRNILSPMRFN